VPLASNLRYHDYEFEISTSAGRWRWKTRLDVTLANPSYSVRDLVTPYGLLRDSIPIPGAVVAAMAQSITELQASFPPTILADPLSLAFTVDQGRGVSDPQSVTLTNTGVYGSLLGATIASSDDYLAVSPALVGNLSIDESGTFDATIDSTDLVSGSSPYAATITLTDATATNSPVTIPVTVTVRPKATISASPAALSFTAVKPVSGTFSPIASQTFTLTNVGPSGSVLAYTIEKLTGLSPWLSDPSPAFGTLASGGSATITVVVAPGPTTAIGTYKETLRISGYSTNSYVDVEVQLDIT
jgi:hypothetical protein